MHIFIYLITSILYCLTPLFLIVCQLSIFSSFVLFPIYSSKTGLCLLQYSQLRRGCDSPRLLYQFPQEGEIGKLIESGSQIALGDRPLRNCRIAKMSLYPNRCPNSSLLSYCRNLLGYQCCCRDHRKFHGRIA